MPYEGSITLDGAEIAGLAADEYRRVVGLVEQDAHVFDTTVEANLRSPAPRRPMRSSTPRSRERTCACRSTSARRTSRAASAAASPIARAFLRDPPILVLDEPTEHVDPEIADALVADLLRPPPDTAILLITHRLTGLDAASEIVTIG